MPITADRDEIIQQNMGLVHACAHKFKGRGIEYEDLFQAGCMGLIKATDAFDRERGVRFSTYAVPVILGEMRRLFRDGGTIKVSRTLKELSLKTMRTKERLSVWQKYFINGEYLRSAEMAEEQNYNMIDGRINNLLPKKENPEVPKKRKSVLLRLYKHCCEVAKKQGKPMPRRYQGMEMERNRK